MSKRRWAICVLLATVLANTGCVACCHKTHQKAWENGADCDIPTPCRGQVHVFMMHGLTPSTDCGLNALRMKLGESGFAKIGTGELCHAGWVKSEIDCIRLNDPDARFVLLGYDYGGATAVSLARDLTAKGVPVEAVVLLDPIGCGDVPSGVRTLLVTSGKVTSRVPHSERICVPDASHFGLPTHPVTVATITALLTNIAVQYCQPPVEEVPEWSYPHAPEVRPVVKAQPAGEWGFLADRPGAARAIGTQVVTKPATPPTTPVAAKR